MRLSLTFRTARKKLLLLKTLPLVFFVTFIWLQYRVDNDAAGPVEYFDNFTELPFTLDVLNELIRSSNERQFIVNAEKFGPLDRNDPVLVIQVHNRGQYLAALIESLRRVEGIEKSLVIFSHDIFDVKINSIVEKIDFCKFLQIFYPYSLQLYPSSFPGTDPKDCPRDINKEEASKRGCLNAAFPDSYGHYREAKYTQTKHHWFWKTNFVMDGLRVTRNYTGYYIFLEEDHYAAPDLFHVLRSMEIVKKKNCPQCDLLTLGIYAKSVNYARNGNRVEIQKWISSRHNMAMVLDKQAWRKIRDCSGAFCSYDDYNWDWSLQHISQKCLKQPLMTLAVAAPRVFHVGECGVHHKGKRCSDNNLVKKVESILDNSKSYLFPSSLQLQAPPKRNFKMPKVNGGWGDKRDHLLCLHHMINSTLTSNAK